ncbi:MAG: MFS transporter [Verrucomicrobiota bacterium]
MTPPVPSETAPAGDGAMHGGGHVVDGVLLQLCGPAGNLGGLPRVEAGGWIQFGPVGTHRPAFMWVYAAGAPLAGCAGDRMQRRHLILGGCLFWSLVTMATAWCQKLWHFITVRALEGFGDVRISRPRCPW